MDNFFKVEVIEKMANPQRTIYGAMHQDYAEEFVFSEIWPEEDKCGQIIVDQLLKGGRGHYGPLEHPQIVFNCGWFPHSTMQQIRTHRVGISFDCQSFRYTGQRIYDLGKSCYSCFSSFPSLIDAMPGGIDAEIEEIFYIRPVGHYTDRQGKKYEVTQQQRLEDLEFAGTAAMHYTKRIDQGFSEEHSRGLIPFDVRQHWVMSANVRSLMHLLDLRWKADAQLECQQLCDLIWLHFEWWVPEVAGWYKENRAKKAKLAP